MQRTIVEGEALLILNEMNLVPAYRSDSCKRAFSVIQWS